MKTSRRFPLTTFGVSPDVKRIHPAFGKINRGDLAPRELAAVLDAYRRLAAGGSLADSHLIIQGETGRYLVGIAGDQLTLRDEGQPPSAGVPKTAAEIIKRLEGQPEIVFVRPPPPPPISWRRGIVAVALFVIGLGLIVRALRPIMVGASAELPADITLVVNPADAMPRQRAVAGLYSTGEGSGDRELTISPEGYIAFAERGPRQSLGRGTDTFRIGQRGSQTCLVTTRSGIFEVVDANTLSYFGDTYRRVN